MSVLNESFDFDKAPQQDKRSFAGHPRKVLLPAGERIHRLLTIGHNYTFSAFWYRKDTFNAIIRQSKGLRVSFNSVARSRLAVKTEWNPQMDHICIGELIHPAYAWQGRCRYQPLSDTSSNVLLMGGLNQIYLPNLLDKDANGNYKSSSDYVHLVYMGPVPDYF